MTTDFRSRTWRLIVALVSALALGGLLVAAACGGDDDDTSGDDGGATATEAADAGNGDGDGGDDGDEPTNEPTNEPTDEPTDDGGDGDGDGGADGDSTDAIVDFAEQSENVTGTVTYDFSSSSDTGAWIIYTEDDNSRIDIMSEDGTAIIITTPEASYTCSSTAGGEGVCLESQGGVGVNPFAGLLASFASADAITGYVEAYGDANAETSSEEIAGADASCYTLEGDFVGDAGTIKWCWADDGQLLLARYDLTSGLFEMRATEFSDSVAPGSFEPPYEVTQFGQ